jgi:hypothetical protein
VGAGRAAGHGSRVAARLAERIPGQLAASVVHGDYRIDNTLLAADAAGALRVAAVVDWELSTIGDPPRSPPASTTVCARAQCRETDSPPLDGASRCTWNSPAVL